MSLDQGPREFNLLYLLIKWQKSELVCEYQVHYFVSFLIFHCNLHLLAKIMDCVIFRALISVLLKEFVCVQLLFKFSFFSKQLKAKFHGIVGQFEKFLRDGFPGSMNPEKAMALSF